MKFPKFMKKINEVLAVISGCMLMAIALLSVFEGIMRSVFHSPTIWTLDLSLYLLVWAIFLGSSYAYQAKGHVAVDFLKDIIEKLFGTTSRRVLSVVGHLISIAVCALFLYTTAQMAVSAVELNQLTNANIQIPAIWLWIGMVIGSVAMLATCIFILLDTFTESKEYV